MNSSGEPEKGDNHVTRTIAISLSEQGGFAKHHFDNLYVLDNYIRGMVPGQAFERSAVHEGATQIFAVFDGMGEGELGVEASRIAAEILDRHRKEAENQPDLPFKDFVRAYVQEANAALCDGIRHNKGLRMGTTFSLLFIRDGIARTANIGNSRVFLYRGESLIQMTYDHTQAQKLVRMGIIGREEARSHPERNVLTQYLGIFPEEMQLEPSFGPTVILQKGDTFVLSSNSVSDVLDEPALQWQIGTADVFSTLPHRIVQQSIQAGSRDNLSLIAVRVLETDTRMAQAAAGSMLDVTTQIPAGEIDRAIAAMSPVVPFSSHPSAAAASVPGGASEPTEVTDNPRARSRARRILVPLAFFLCFILVGVAAAKMMFSWDALFGRRPTLATTTVSLPTGTGETTLAPTTPAGTTPAPSSPPTETVPSTVPTTQTEETTPPTTSEPTSTSPTGSTTTPSSEPTTTPGVTEPTAGTTTSTGSTTASSEPTSATSSETSATTAATP